METSDKFCRVDEIISDNFFGVPTECEILGV